MDRGSGSDLVAIFISISGGARPATHRSNYSSDEIAISRPLIEADSFRLFAGYVEFNACITRGTRPIC